MSRILITSATPYINGVKHLGNLAGSLLPADIHARFQRQLGNEVLFISGTDEHGTAAELAAKAAGEAVAPFCAREHQRQRAIYSGFGLSFDHFGRSSAPSNHALTQHFYRRLDAAGLIEERTVPQIWSPADRRFLADRYVLGTCPHCRSEEARGDQCEACGALLDPTELIAPRSALSGSRALEVRKSRHLFLLQSCLRERLSCWLDSRRGWPPFVSGLARSWLTADLRDRCITRDLAWGVPVPRPGFEGKVFYVWFDAPIAYIAITQDWAAVDPANRDWRRWWCEEDDVRYVQFLAKDNVPFHAVSFPATLLGAGEGWKTVDTIKGFHWLTYAGGKFSTSRQRGIFTDAALEALPADLWRWWLTTNAPETADSDFTIGRFAADVNKDLADIFGNLVNRTLRFTEQAFEGRNPRAGCAEALEHALAAEVARLVDEIRRHHEQLELRRAAAATRALWVRANAYLHETAPWAAMPNRPERAAAVTRTALALVRLGAETAWSIVPSLAGAVLTAFGHRAELPAWPRDVEARLLGTQDAGRTLAPLGPLVRKIEARQIEELEARFRGGG